MGKKLSPTLVGAFVLGAIALAVIGVIVFGSGKLFRTAERFVIFFEGSVNGLRIGAPVKIKGVQIGEVVEIRLGIGNTVLLSMDPPRIPVIIDVDLEMVRARGGAGTASQAEQQQRLVDEGLRAQLNMESFVTGLLYVSFDFFPDTQAQLVGGPTLPYPELPAIPTALEEAQSAATEIINKLKEMKFEEMLTDLSEASRGVNQLVNSPGLKAGVDSFGQVMANANKTLEELQGAVSRVDKLAANLDNGVSDVQKELASTTKEMRLTLEQATGSLNNVRMLTRPEAPLAQQLNTTLKDLSDASRQLSNFLDYLERNPSALLRGKGAADDKQEQQ